MSEEEVIEGPLKPLDKVDKELYDWQPPDTKTVRTKRRIAQIEAWIESKHAIMNEEEVVRYAMTHFNLTRENAKHYLNRVVEDFKRLGIPVLEK